MRRTGVRDRIVKPPLMYDVTVAKTVPMCASGRSPLEPVRRSDTGDRWVAVGSSVEADSFRAGADAAHGAARDADVKLLMVFALALHDPAAVLAGIRSVAPDASLIGCSTSATIPPAGRTDVPGVVVVGLGGSGFSVTTRVAEGVTGRQRSAGAEVAGCVAELDERPHQVLVLLTDGLIAGPVEVLAGAYSVVGASLPVVGGVSCPWPSMTRTFQLHGDQVVTGAVVGAAIASDGPFGVGVRHGWRRVGEPMIVTKSDHNVVHTLDDQPAAPAYLSRLGAPPEAFVEPAAFERFAECRPIGVRNRSGEVVRNVGSSYHLADGWLQSPGDVPEGALIWPMEGDQESVLDAAGDACADAITMLGAVQPLGLIAFDCETRARFLGDEGTRAEVARMQARVDSASLAGLYTWGEIARTRGINGFHNHTLVVLAVS
jgi:hypothetical protein